MLLFTHDDKKKSQKIHRCRQVRTDPEEYSKHLIKVPTVERDPLSLFPSMSLLKFQSLPNKNHDQSGSVRGVRDFMF